MRSLAILALAFTLAEGRANAQPQPWEPERITAGWVFTPAVVFGGMWDSNVTVRAEGEAETAELVGMLAPRGTLDFNGRRTKFNLGYSGTLETYRNLDELTRYDQRGRMEVRYDQTPRLQFVSRANLALVPTTDQLELGGLPFERIGSRMLDTMGGFTFALTPRTSLGGEYRFQWVRFERDDPRFAFLRGGHAHSPAATIQHRLSSRFAVGAAYEYRHSLIGGGEELVDVQQAIANATYQIGPGLEARVGGGLSVLHLSTTDETLTGPAVRLGATAKRREVVLDVNYDRSFVPSFGFGGTNVNQELRGSVFVPFASGRFWVSTGAAYRRSEPLTVRGLDVLLNSLWTQASVGYGVARWLRMEAFYAGVHQESSARGNVDRTRVGLQFVTLKPMRIQ